MPGEILRLLLSRRRKVIVAEVGHRRVPSAATERTASYRFSVMKPYLESDHQYLLEKRGMCIFSIFILIFWVSTPAHV